MVLMRAKFGTLAGTMLLKSRRMKYQFLMTGLLRTPDMLTRMRNIRVMKRKNEVARDHILRLRVATLICSLLSSGTMTGGVEPDTAVSSDFRRRLKMFMISGAATGVDHSCQQRGALK